MSNSSILGWHCYQPGDLNPGLNKLSFRDLLADPMLVGTTSNSMDSIGEAIGRSIRPDKTRGKRSSPIFAVVLGGYIVEGQEALSLNMAVESSGFGAHENRVTVLYIRVPELTHLSDPYCNENTFTPIQREYLKEMHPTAAIPRCTTGQSIVVPGSIVEVEFIEGWTRAVVRKVCGEATSLMSQYEAASAAQAFNAAGAGVFLGAPIKGAEGSHEFVELMRASPHLKDYSDAMLAALASNAQHESGFVLNANGDAVSGYFKSPNVSQAKRDRVKANALGKMCSHGFWQMNVCATDGGGQRFAAHFNLDVVNDKKALVAAFADQEKQFEMIDIEMRHLFGGDVSAGTETAEYYAGRISAEYERCHSCYVGGNQWQSRSKVAMGIYSTITTTTTATT